MLRLTSKTISASAKARLADQQAKIMLATPFDQQVTKAQSLWDNKTQGRGEAAFGEIKKALLSMCIGVEICNYCENNEATDIEHIYPKSSFPEKAFDWDNYLLACKICNTPYKSDDFAVFDPAGSASLCNLTPRQSPRLAPPTQDGSFINPRWENPLNFLWLDIQGLTFNFAVHPNLKSNRNKEKAVYTRDLLQLNNRRALRDAREAACGHFVRLLREYTEVKAASSLAALVIAVNEPRLVDHRPFTRQRVEFMVSLRRDIRSYPHPTVWQELKRQRKALPKTNSYFLAAPEALSW
ncbi:MAG: HNH endonuclease [Janthinobacterium lividum]